MMRCVIDAECAFCPTYVTFEEKTGRVVSYRENKSARKANSSGRPT